MAKIIPIILCGGSGQRLLPFLKRGVPKQFLSILQNGGNLLQNTILRFVNNENFSEPLIVTSLRYREEIMLSLEQYSLKAKAILWEPEGRNTGPAMAAALNYLKAKHYGPDQKIVLVPIDHYLEDIKLFTKTLTQVADFLQKQDEAIVTLSIKSSGFEANYGHLKVLDTKDSFKQYHQVLDFVEKPQERLEDPNLLWNSGIYSMSVKSCSNLLQKQVPHLLEHSRRAVLEGFETKGHSSFASNEIILNTDQFAKNSSLSFDQIITYPNRPGTLFCTDIGTKWEDIGIWTGISRMQAQTAQTKATVINREIFLEGLF